MVGEAPGLEDLRVYAWETASLTPTRLLAVEGEIGALFGWSEGISIVTCQRFEMVAMNECAYLSAHHSYRGTKALLHLARLASGLESLVLGEAEILGQVRSAFSAAPPALRRLVTPAIAAARALRREAGFAQHAGYALDLAVEHFNLVPEGSLLTVGGGPMGRRVAERAAQLGFNVTLVARRPPPLPPDIVYQPFSMLASLEPTDVLVSCLGRSAPQMGRGDLPAVRQVAIDLGTPRNLKADLQVPVITLSDLIESHRSHGLDTELRSTLGDRLEALLAARLAMGQPDSPLGTLRIEIERIRQRELMRSLRLHPELPPGKLDTITRSLVNQIFHRPTQHLRQADDPELADALAALFRPRSQDEPSDGA